MVQNKTTKPIKKQKSVQKKTPVIAQTEAPKKTISFFEWGVFILGVFCVMAGFGLVIASNWDIIPAFIKLVGGLTLLGGGIYASYTFHQKERPLLTEIALFFSFLMIGGNIGLIQQLYHLSISFSEGSLVWAVLGTPFLFLTKRLLLPVVWVVLLGFGLFDYLKDLIDFLGYKGVASVFFLLFLLSYFGTSRRMTALKNASLGIMMGVLFWGDFGVFGDPFSLVGLVLTIVTVGLLAHAQSEQKPVRFFNIVLLYAAARVVMTFWIAYVSLFRTGIALMALGALIIAVGVLYYYYKEKILALLDKGFNQ